MTDRSAGFTLVEVLTATFLFALIGLAGLVLITSIGRVNERTGDRLDSLAELERAWFLVTRDVERAILGTLHSDGQSVSFDRTAAGPSRVLALRYELTDRTLMRTAGPARQQLVDGLSSARWDFLDSAGVWHDRWPPDNEDRPVSPAALALTLSPDPALRGRSGDMRRVVVPPHGQP